MGYFAQIDDEGFVTQVISISNETLGEPDLSFPETEEIGQTFIRDVLGLTGEWRQTSYNNSFRGRYAGIGFLFDNERDVFVHPLWTLVDGVWTAPLPPPDPEVEALLGAAE